MHIRGEIAFKIHLKLCLFDVIPTSYIYLGAFLYLGRWSMAGESTMLEYWQSGSDARHVDGERTGQEFSVSPGRVRSTS